MRRSFKAHLLALTVTLGFGCTGLDETGVRTIEFELLPTGEVVSGLDEARSTALQTASGLVFAEAHDGHGEMTCSGLPALPEGMEYEVELMMVDDERAGLPGMMRGGHDDPHAEESNDEHADEEPHDEPADAAHGSAPEEPHMESVHVEFDFDDHGCQLEFGDAELGRHHMGGLRGLNVHLKTPDGEKHMVLTGAIDDEAEVEGGGGHAHGV